MAAAIASLSAITSRVASSRIALRPVASASSAPKNAKVSASRRFPLSISAAGSNRAPQRLTLVKALAQAVQNGVQEDVYEEYFDDEEYDDYEEEDDDVDNTGRMMLFLDSASVAEYRKWLPTGLFHGVTTNPLILEKDGVKCTLDAISELVESALETGWCEEFQIQAWGNDLAEMGRVLAGIDDSVVVTLPATVKGIEAANELLEDEIPVTITAVHAAHQAVLAASIGANYVAPFLGRINDAKRDGFASVVAMQDIVQKMDSDMRILVASIRTPEEISSLAAKGVDTFTISPAVAEKMFGDPLTISAAKDFEDAVIRNSGTAIHPWI